MSWIYDDLFGSRVRTLREVLNLNCEETILSLKTECQASSASSDENVIRDDGSYFNVLWTKPSTRKKKIWEGDGRLKVKDNVATLYGEDGKVLSSGASPPSNLLYPGSIFKVGSKEVEIIDAAVENEPSKNEDDDRPKSKKFKPNTVTVERRGFVKPYDENQTKPLVFPSPPVDHQRKFNQNEKPSVTVTMDAFLQFRLRLHQREGIIFLYKCVMGFERSHNGVILADEMGLGKTLQCIALIWTLLKKGPYGVSVIRRALIVSPSTLCASWNKEFLKWVGRERLTPYVVDNAKKPNGFLKNRDTVMIISYERLVKHVSEIEDIGFDLIVCDEAHRLKNSNIKATQCLQKLECNRRILLTGTPIQNDLQEFFVLSDVANPGIFGTYSEFRKQFEEPILRSQKPDCEEDLRNIGEERVDQLNAIMSTFVLRRDQSIMRNLLPSKIEYVVCCAMTDIQKDLYASIVDEWWNRREILNISPLTLIVLLKKICNHPSLLKIKDETEDKFYNNIINLYKSVQHKISEKSSTKLSTLASILNYAVLNNHEKVVVVSCSTQMLDIIGEKCQLLKISHTRLDGNTPVQQRQGIVDKFNSNINMRNAYLNIPYVLLLSSRAGGAGLSLPAASRLILFDSDWNPAIDNQAMARIWRDGQKKLVHIYRFVTSGTIEEKIYQRQIFKTGLSDAVLSNKAKTTLKLCENELKDLFSFSFDSESSTHDMLNCSCSGEDLSDGGLFVKETDDKENVDSKNVTPINEDSSKSINQLKLWEHLRPPFNENFLQRAGLSEVADKISFMFRKIYEKNNI